ncbi:MAG: TonB-dependent receptor plug domain-containing protein [Alphaproteobacteria bacterium]
MTLQDYLRGAAALSILMASTSAMAQDAAPDVVEEPDVTEVAAQDIDDVVFVTGTRQRGRTVADSPVPVDVFGVSDIEDVSFTDTNNILQTLVPSFSVGRQPISDGGTFVRPAALRGLPTDKTLVLVNSKRRHRAALVQIGGSGTQGPDIATIPFIALKNIEVLRDGASAQYGSDAIAGVINFNLQDATEGITLISQVGQFYAGDGFDYLLTGNVGLPLGDSGFFNASFEYTQADQTIRAEQYCESFFCVPEFAALPGNEAYAAAVSRASLTSDIVQPWGRPNSEAFRTFVNMGYTFSAAAEAYGFANYSWSESDGSFFYRFPNNGTIEDLRLEDGSIYSPLEIFPGGFTPRFSGIVVDYSGVAGLRGEFDVGFTYDLSFRFGHSEIQYTLMNTINPSLGPATPTSFRPGDLINEELQLQGDFTQPFDVGLASPLLVAFGVSYLEESYEVVEGEPASFEAGPFATPDPFGFCNDDGTPTMAGADIADLNCADPNDPVFQVVGVGSNGFPGYSPQFSDVFERDSYAFYVDLSTDVTDRLFVQASARYESYSDQEDDVFIYKLAAQYDLFDRLSVRGSVGTGFRAPTPGQQGTTNVSTRLPDGVPVATGLFPANSAVAEALGATPLEPEESTSFAAGLVGSIWDINFTLDFYRINLRDRVNAISTITVVDDCDPSTPEIDTGCLGFRGNLIDAGVVGAESIGGVFYFTNAFDTVTQGFDFVATYTRQWETAGDTDFTLSVNYNQTEFDGEVSDLFNAESQFDFENGLPDWRAILTARHMWDDWIFLGRLNYFGGYEQSNGGGTITQVQEFSPEVFVDLEGTYVVNDTYRLSLGVRNLFDNFPDKGTIGETCCGRIYRSDSIVDWQGGYYYFRATATF